MVASPLSRAAFVCGPLLSCLFHPPAAADPARLDPIVVTATRTRLPIADVLSDVVVIDAQAIRNAGAASLAELLQSHGGAEVASNGGPGQTSGIFLRGANANHVVLLVDGVRVNSASAGTNAFENLPLAQIERIEIRRGPSSSLYGADAIGGVIQVFTRQAPRTEATVGFGTWRTYEASAGFARASGAMQWSVQVGASGSRAFSATNPANTYSYDPDRDPTHGRNIGLSVEHAFAPGHVLAARALHSERTTHFDSGLDFDGNYSDDLNRQRLASAAIESRNRITDGWTSRLRLARGTDDGRIRGVFPSVFRTDQDQASWQNDLDALGGRLALGAEWRREKVASDTSFAVDRRSIRSIFASHAAQWGAHLLQVSARRDANSQFGSRNTGNAAYGFRLGDVWRVSASAGTAFKAPSFNDLYYDSPYFVGNPALRPERSRSAELALRYDDGRWRAGLVRFDSRIADLIAVDSTFTTVDNVASARIRGTTASAALSTGGGWQAHAEWTHQDAVNADTGMQLVRRARDHGRAGLSGARGPWRAGIDVVASGARYDTASNDPASRLAGYGLVNLHAAYRWSPEWTVSARVANLGDRVYELVRGYNTAGRNLFVAVAYQAP
ncbi:MAG: TonB-dependent receptor [Burkholderiaceae bacterium]